MGSIRLDDESRAREVKVLVTGFGPFGNNHTNPSYLIASSLPTEQKVPGHPAVKIHVHPSPIVVAYKTIRETIPRLLFPEPAKTEHPKPNNFYKQSNNAHLKTNPAEPRPNFDIVLHIGMAPGCGFYSMETWAHRDGYTRKDVDQETLEGDTFWKQQYGAPQTLPTSFDGEDVLQRWKLELPDQDLRISTDAGRYLCDFIYYTSLVEYWRRNPDGPRPVVFLHVPGRFENEDIERGRAVTLGLIKALAASFDGFPRGDRETKEAKRNFKGK